MSALPIERVSVEDYFEIERTNEQRFEYLSGKVVEKIGGSIQHNTIKGNFAGLLYQQLRKQPCYMYASKMRVRFSPSHYSYPDIAVVCGEKHIDPHPLDTLLNPTVIIEVLSPSTATHDKTNKARDFRALASIQEYLFISQHDVYIEHYSRQNANEWILREITDVTSAIELKSIGCTLLVEDIYEKVEFSQP